MRDARPARPAARPPEAGAASSGVRAEPRTESVGAWLAILGAISVSYGRKQKIGQDAGVAAHAGGAVGVLALAQRELVGRPQLAQPALGQQLLVDRSQAALEQGVDRRAE